MTNLKRQEKDIKTEIRRASGSDDLEEGECEDTDDDDDSLEDQSGKSRDAAQVGKGYMIIYVMFDCLCPLV